MHIKTITYEGMTTHFLIHEALHAFLPEGLNPRTLLPEDHDWYERVWYELLLIPLLSEHACTPEDKTFTCIISEVITRLDVTQEANLTLNQQGIPAREVARQEGIRGTLLTSFLLQPHGQSILLLASVFHTPRQGKPCPPASPQNPLGTRVILPREA